MVDIYRNSFLTLAATASSSDDGGLFYTQTPKNQTQRLFGYGPDGKPYNLYFRQRIRHLTIGPLFHCQGKVEDVPLLARAWAYQEILLSPRVLHFGKRELSWECMEHTACECGELQGRKPTGQVVYERHKIQHSQSFENCPNDQALHSRWRRMVGEYSGLGLTVATDKLPALSGLAKQMQRHRPRDRYLAGLWARTLFTDLLWISRSIRGEGSTPADVNAGEVNAWPSVSGISSKWRAPTWSWANIENPVRYQMCDVPKAVYARLVDARIVPAPQSDETGQLTSAEIVLEGRLLPGLVSNYYTPLSLASVCSSFEAACSPAEGLYMDG